MKLKEVFSKVLNEVKVVVDAHTADDIAWAIKKALEDADPWDSGADYLSRKEELANIQKKMNHLERGLGVVEGDEELLKLVYAALLNLKKFQPNDMSVKSSVRSFAKYAREVGVNFEDSGALHEGGKNIKITFDNEEQASATANAIHTYLDKSRNFDPWQKDNHTPEEVNDLLGQIDSDEMTYLWDEDERKIVKAAINFYLSQTLSNPRDKTTLARVMAKLG